MGVERLFPRFPRVAIGKFFPWATLDHAAPPPPDPLEVEAAPDGPAEGDGGNGDPNDPGIDADECSKCERPGLLDDSTIAGDNDDDELDSMLGSSDDSSDDGGGSDGDFEDLSANADGGMPVLDVSRSLHLAGPQHVLHQCERNNKRVAWPEVRQCQITLNI